MSVMSVLSVIYIWSLFLLTFGGSERYSLSLPPQKTDITDIRG